MPKGSRTRGFPLFSFSLTASPMMSISGSGDAVFWLKNIWPSRAARMRASVSCWFPWWFPVSMSGTGGDSGFWGQCFADGPGHSHSAGQLFRTPSRPAPKSGPHHPSGNSEQPLKTRAGEGFGHVIFGLRDVKMRCVRFTADFSLRKTADLNPVVTLPIASAGSPPEVGGCRRQARCCRGCQAVGGGYQRI